MIQIPDAFYCVGASDFELPPAGAYATGLVFLPTDAAGGDARAKLVLEKYALVEGARGARLAGRADRPDGSRRDRAGRDAAGARRSSSPRTGSARGRQAAAHRARAGPGRATASASRPSGRPASAAIELYFPSLSARTITYKGMLTPDQLPASSRTCPTSGSRRRSRWCTPGSPRTRSRRGRWRTRTGIIAHNGEINTIRGNKNWMSAREALLATANLPGQHQRLFPICTPRGVRLGQLRRGARAAAPGRPQPAARGADDDPGGVGERPAAWTPRRRAFYRFHASLMEPWDGPASVAFTDGTVVGAVLDRNGLRPGRWWHTARRPGRAGPARRACSTSTRPPWSPRAACSRARCSWSTPRPAGSCTTTRSRPSWPPPSRTTTGCTPGSSSSPTCPSASTSSTRTTRCSAGSRCSATPRRS